MFKEQDITANVSYAAQNCRNYIRELVDNLDLQPNPNKTVIALSIGDPTVYGNLKAPQIAEEALIEAVSSGKYNGYAPCSGYWEARCAVAEYLQAQPEDVILCSGCSSALELCITTLTDGKRGDNILVPSPGFPLYRTLAESLGVEVRHYNLIPDRNWEIDLQHLLSQIDNRTTAIVLNNPSNPCGAVYSEKHLKDFFRTIPKIPVIADEIYERLVFKKEEFVSTANISERKTPVLICGGLAKRFLVPGWRLGWILIQDFDDKLVLNQIRKGLNALSQRTIGANTLVQGALSKILKNTPDDFHRILITNLETNATVIMTILNNVNGLKPFLPQGAMYMMIQIQLEKFPTFSNCIQFVEKLMDEESVFCLPGEIFSLPGFVRIVLTVPEDLLREACRRLAEFCERYHGFHM